MRPDDQWHSWPQGTQQALMEARGREVAEDLIGTCQSIGIYAEEEEIDDPAFSAALDDLCFCCEACEWWCSTDEEAYQGICDGCAEEGHGL